jgi:hypothetical protein
VTKNTKKRAKHAGYDWDTWFKRKSFTLREGVDFRCLAHSMIVQIRNAAASRGRSVSIKAAKGTLAVTVH